MHMALSAYDHQLIGLGRSGGIISSVSFFLGDLQLVPSDLGDMFENRYRALLIGSPNQQ